MHLLASSACATRWSMLIVGARAVSRTVSPRAVSVRKCLSTGPCGSLFPVHAYKDTAIRSSAATSQCNHTYAVQNIYVFI
jgi:hypothetical protein